MGTYTIKLPDIGEGIVEAEIDEWNVKLGDVINEDDILGTVMTEKASVEVPSIVGGKIIWLAGEVGDFISIGATYVELEVLGEGNKKNDGLTENSPTEQTFVQPTDMQPIASPIMTSPSLRKRALNENIDLAKVKGSGPKGRITQQDLDDFIADKTQANSDNLPDNKGIKAIKVVGMRRLIANKMSLAKSKIAHITIIEEIDVNDLEELRIRLNEQYADQREKLTILSFIMRAIIEAVKQYPKINALYDDEAGIIYQHENVNIGIATQTEAGLSVPVVKHAKTLSLWQCAQQISHLAQVARNGEITPDELQGSTITISSLGALGALATTPIINHPEVAIIGINKIAIRPNWNGEQFLPSKMMNISCSFDHRVIDGYDAAQFIQKLKSLLENPKKLLAEKSIVAAYDMRHQGE